MTEEDVAAVARLDEEVFPDASLSMEDRVARFRDELTRPFAVILVADERVDSESAVAGYLLAWTSVNEGHLLNVAVAAPYRRQKIASSLVQAMLADPRFVSVEVVILEVRESNVGARLFYERAGFTLSRTRRSYYPNGEDALELIGQRDELRFG